MMGSYFRGRPLAWDPDRQVIEQERQRWAYEQVGKVNELIVDLAVDPERQYEIHRRAYEDSGDPVQLTMMLEYVR